MVFALHYFFTKVRTDQVAFTELWPILGAFEIVQKFNEIVLLYRSSTIDRTTNRMQVCFLFLDIHLSNDSFESKAYEF